MGEQVLIDKVCPNSLTLAELARLIQREHQQCQAHPTTALLSARNAGEWLLEAKAVLAPDRWQAWLTAECGLVEQTAQTYMAIARDWPRLGSPPVSVRLEPKDSEPLPVETPESVSSEPPLEEFLQQPEELDYPVETLTFFIPGTVVPKARPRVTSNGTFLPKRYQEWRNRAEGEIIMQLARQETTLILPLEKATVEVHLIGKHRMNADGDNIVGSCLDALVAVGVIKNDNLSYIPEIYFKLVPKGNQGVRITLIPQ